MDTEKAERSTNVSISLPLVPVCGATHFLIELSGFDEEMSML